MNRQSEKQISYCGWTWNPTSGCAHSWGRCTYCYVGNFLRYSKGEAKEIGPHLWIAEPGAVFPKGMDLTFYPHRLGEPAKEKTPARIFVCNTGDLFCRPVPFAWQKATFDACLMADWHTYLFLTKDPASMTEAFRARLCNDDLYLSPPPWWPGVTITNTIALQRLKYMPLWANTWVSFEPLLGDIDWSTLSAPFHLPRWAVIGEQTGKDAIFCEPSWVERLISELHNFNIPVYVKDPLYKRFPIREYPEEWREAI